MKENESMPDASVDKNASLWSVISIALVTAVGAALRLYQLDGQIVGDDEWHAIKVASQSTYSFIFTHFNAADNSIPLTLIYKLFIDTVGLNELTLHILQAVVGILVVPVFYLLAAKVIGRHASMIFACFLSLSPFLIYYSRFARPYIFVVFFSFIALLSFFFWWESRNRWYLFIYVAGGILASYFSPVSFPSFAAPLLFCLLFAVLNRKLQSKGKTEPAFPAREAMIAGIALGCGVLAWLLPAVGSIDAVSSKAGKGDIKLSTLSGFLQLSNGFENLWIAMGLLAVAVVGLFSLYRSNKGLFYFIVTIVSIQLLSMIVVVPYRVELSHVFTRYNISCLPFYLMLVALGLQSLTNAAYAYLVKTQPSKMTITSVIVLVVSISYISLSPLGTIYGVTNNFSNHDDFQFNYTSEVFNKRVDSNKISRFYRDLGRESASTSIIEYPYVLWWSGNSYHYYQQIHQKRVSIGFLPPFYLLQPIISNQQVNLKNFVNIDSNEALIRSGAKYVVIHKDIAWEAVHIRDIFGGGIGLTPEVRASANFLEERYGAPSRSMAEFIAGGMAKRLGRPCFEDEWLTVFRVPGSPAGEASLLQR